MAFLKMMTGLYWSPFHRRPDSSGSTPDSPAHDSNPFNVVLHWIHLDPCKQSDYLRVFASSMGLYMIFPTSLLLAISSFFRNQHLIYAITLLP